MSMVMMMMVVLVQRVHSLVRRGYVCPSNNTSTPTLEEAGMR